MKKFRLIAPALVLILTACAMQTAGNLQTIRLPLGYIPNIQFAPLYVADEKGYFADAGIKVDFDYSMENDITALVGADQIQFGVVSGDQILLARAQGLPVVYVAAWYQQYPISVVSKTSLEIQVIEDLRGKKIGLPGLYGANYIGLRALLHVAGLTEADVILDPIGYTQVESLATDHDPLVSVYTTNEPVQLRALGFDLNELRVADFVQLASNGLVTNEKTITEDPDLVQRMVTAFLHGLSDVIADPTSAYVVSMNYVDGLKADDPVQMQVLNTSIDLWKAERPGYTQPQAWVNMQEVLLEMGLLTHSQDLTGAYTNSFIP